MGYVSFREGNQQLLFTVWIWIENLVPPPHLEANHPIEGTVDGFDTSSGSDQWIWER